MKSTTNIQNVAKRKMLVYEKKNQSLQISGRERSGSVVECLTRDRGATGLILTGVTALWSLSKTHISSISTGSTQEDMSPV